MRAKNIPFHRRNDGHLAKSLTDDEIFQNTREKNKSEILDIIEEMKSVEFNQALSMITEQKFDGYDNFTKCPRYVGFSEHEKIGLLLDTIHEYSALISD